MRVENKFNKEKPKETAARGNITSASGHLGSSNRGSNSSRRADELLCEGAAASAGDVRGCVTRRGAQPPPRLSTILQSAVLLSCSVPHTSAAAKLQERAPNAVAKGPGGSISGKSLEVMQF